MARVRVRLTLRALWDPAFPGSRCRFRETISPLTIARAPSSPRSHRNLLPGPSNTSRSRSGIAPAWTTGASSARTSLTAPRSTRRRSKRAVGDAYRAIAESLRASGHHPVRFWNFVPGIHADMGGGLDRYMVFNAGRYAAFEAWFGQAALFTRTVPTASAVGNRLGGAGRPRARQP